MSSLTRAVTTSTLIRKLLGHLRPTPYAATRFFCDSTADSNRVDPDVPAQKDDDGFSAQESAAVDALKKSLSLFVKELDDLKGNSARTDRADSDDSGRGNGGGGGRVLDRVLGLFEKTVRGLDRVDSVDSAEGPSRDNTLDEIMARETVALVQEMAQAAAAERGEGGGKQEGGGDDEDAQRFAKTAGMMMVFLERVASNLCRHNPAINGLLMKTLYKNPVVVEGPKYPFNIAEDEDAVFVRIDMPGVNAKGVKVWVENGCLHMKGEEVKKKDEKYGGIKEEARKYSTSMDAISRDHYQIDKIEARVENGVLRLTVPKVKN